MIFGLSLLALLSITSINSQYLLEVFEKTPLGGRRPLARCEATGATFGQDILDPEFVNQHSVACALATIPESACTNVKPQFNGTHCQNNYAIVPRGNCSFTEKAYFVQEAHPRPFNALVVVNFKGEPLLPMGGSKYEDKIKIPAVMVAYECMETVLHRYSATKGYLVSLRVQPGYYDLIKYLVPFVAIVGFCFIVLLVSLLVRICRERRRIARKRLSRSHLKKIPTKKWKRGEPEETCPICLDDFQEGDKLRILLCKHAYHCKCIDPWLTKNRKVCPVCKRKVGPKSKDGDSSDSDYDDRTQTTTNENESLIRNAQPMATNSSAEFPYLQQSIPSLLNSNNNSSTDNWLNNVRPGLNSSTNVGNPSSSQYSVSVSIEETGQNSNNRASRLSEGLTQLRIKISALIKRSNNPHTLLEDDSVSRDGDIFTRRLSTPATTTENTSIDGHSMTTVHSNRHLVTVEVEPCRYSSPQNDTGGQVENTESILGPTTGSSI